MGSQNFMVIPPGDGYSSLMKGDQPFLSSLRPTFSFQYSSIQFSASEKSYFFNNEKYEMTPEQIAEVDAYIASVDPDPEITAQVVINIESKKYLARTDWYVIRFLESGVPIPEDVAQARADARERVVHL